MRFWFIIFGLIIPLVAQETPLRAFEGHVYDPGKWLLDERREELDAMLEKAEEQWSKEDLSLSRDRASQSLPRTVERGRECHTARHLEGG
ncbi:MAG: hypothetical protein ABF377_12545 [Akkermansiaceae bacterium]